MDSRIAEFVCTKNDYFTTAFVIPLGIVLLVTGTCLFLVFRLLQNYKPEADKKEAADILRDAFGKKVRSRTGRRLL